MTSATAGERPLFLQSTGLTTSDSANPDDWPLAHGRPEPAPLGPVKEPMISIKGKDAYIRNDQNADLSFAFRMILSISPCFPSFRVRPDVVPLPLRIGAGAPFRAEQVFL